jgi:hypothetical protein
MVVIRVERADPLKQPIKGPSGSTLRRYGLTRCIYREFPNVDERS